MQKREYKDKDLVSLPPAILNDMKILGGNVRRGKTRKNWSEFVQDIKRQGVLQSVVARPLPDGSLELLAGYGRRDASVELGLKEIPVQIRLVDDVAAMDIHLSENISRIDLSFADQIVWTKRFLSLYNGDVESAANRLGWSASKLRERSTLIPCTEAVLDALDAGKIKVKHALVLSAFQPNVQDNTLAKIIAEGWSVAELKQRADRVQVPLAKAIFEKSECSNCQHNTELQSGLFGMPESAMCAKSSCFHAKTKEALEAKKAQAEERYGTVVWLSQSLPAHRATVSPVVVGKGQFDSGCKGCADRVSVIDDSPTGTPGSILESQCTNLECFKDCTSAHDAFVASQQAKATSQDNPEIATEADAPAETKATQDSANVTPLPKKAPAKVKGGAVSQVLQELHWKELRQAAGAFNNLDVDGKFGLVMQLVGLIEISKFKSIRSLDKSMPALMAKPEAELKAMIATVMDHIRLKATNICGFDANKVMTAAAMSVEGGHSALVAAWTPSQEVLNKYTCEGLEQIVKLSGFDKHLDAKEEGAAKKLLASKKGDFVTGILAVSDFDWSHFAPPAYVDLAVSSTTTQQDAA